MLQLIAVTRSLLYSLLLQLLLHIWRLSSVSTVHDDKSQKRKILLNSIHDCSLSAILTARITHVQHNYQKPRKTHKIAITATISGKYPQFQLVQIAIHDNIYAIFCSIPSITTPLCTFALLPLYVLLNVTIQKTEKIVFRIIIFWR